MIIGSSAALLVLVLYKTKLILRILDNVQKIEQMHPGHVGIDVSGDCPDKADILIWYTSHEYRVKIEKIINSKTFFGIPYRLENI